MWTEENRARYDRKVQRYPSDLMDEEWALVEPLLPPERQVSPQKSGRRPLVLTTACEWRQLPKDLPPKSTVHDYLIEWQLDGTLARIHLAPFFGRFHTLAVNDG